MDKKQALNKAHQGTFYAGLVVLALAFIFRFDGGIGAFRPMGIATLVVCPLLGLLGLGLSIKNRSLVFGLLNLTLVFSFFIMMYIGYNL